MNAKKYHTLFVASIEKYVEKIDSEHIPECTTEIRLFAIARNESLRMDYFLKYYMQIGVDRFFILDNDSKDDTVAICKQYQNVHVFSISLSYKHHWFWMEYFLDKYGMNSWCIVVDIDELVCYPLMSQKVDLKLLASYMARYCYSAMRFLLLDMYSNKPVQDINYCRGQDPIKHCCFFDPEFNEVETILLDKRKWVKFNTIVYTGGMRERVFGSVSPHVMGKYLQMPYFLSKISFFKKRKRNYLTQGMHAINGSRIADVRGVVFHTKFLQDFISEVDEEVLRQEHFDSAIMYKIFKNKIDGYEQFCLMGKNSVKYESYVQLIDLDIMQTSDLYENYVYLKTSLL